MSHMEHAISIIEQKMDECYKAMRMGVNVTYVTGAFFVRHHATTA